MIYTSNQLAIRGKTKTLMEAYNESKCRCNSAHFCPDENQWEPGYECDYCFDWNIAYHTWLVNASQLSPCELALKQQSEEEMDLPF
jgi:hypothetical protein